MDDSSDREDSCSPEQCWRGCSMEEIHVYLNEFELPHMPEVRPSEKHSVLYQYPIRTAANEPPRPLKGHHKWDAFHVRLPCSSKSQYPIQKPDGSVSIESRWEMVEQALLRPINNSRELQTAILAYNQKYEKEWAFPALHQLFEVELSVCESQAFFRDLLPRIIRLALRLPELIQAPIPLMRQGQNRSISLTQEQISCLVANAFLCTFPRRNTMKKRSEYSMFPNLNFNRLYQATGPSVMEKIKCICHYFRRVCPTENIKSNVPAGVVTFQRRSFSPSEMFKWGECRTPIGVTPLHISSEGTIEDNGLGLLQVDFANKFIGGGVLGYGCVQEEIRFVICPELFVAKIFTECLRPNEALLIGGCERFSDYEGYAASFQWAGNHDDITPRDSSRRMMTYIVAIDALAFRQPAHQYRPELILRELNKAYVGFYHPLETPAPGVASGNWGCGAFNGDAKLKALLQLMVCTAVKRPLVYYAFGNEDTRNEVHRMHTFFIEENIRVKDLWTVLSEFEKEHMDFEDMYDFIYTNVRQARDHSRTAEKIDCAKDVPSNSSDPSTVNFSVYTPSLGEEFNSGTITNVNVSNNSRLQGPSSSQVPISGESQTDALLKAAAAELKTYCHLECDNSQQIIAQSSPQSPAKKLKQRTILQWVDEHNSETSPATKRHCHDGSPSKDSNLNK